MTGMGGSGGQYVRNIQRAADSVGSNRKKRRRYGGKRWDIHLRRRVRRRDRLQNETFDTVLIVFTVIGAVIFLFSIRV